MNEPNSPLSRPPEFLRGSVDLPGGARQSRVFYGRDGLRAGWRLLIFLAALSALFSITAMVMRLLFSHRGTHAVGITPGAALLGEGVPFLFVLIASWVMATIEFRKIADYGLPPTGIFAPKFWQGIVMGFTSISALLGAMRLAGAFHFDGIALHGVDIWKYATLWGIAFIVVGLFEEFLFRGYALFTLTTGIGFWPSAFVLSALFGYVHHGNSGENWVGASAAALVGLLFCLMLRRTGDLWLPIGFHAAWDWGETYFYGVPDSGQVAAGHLFYASLSGPHWLTGGTVGPEGSYLCLALIGLLILIFAVWPRGAKYPNPRAIRPPGAAEPVGLPLRATDQ
jgi:membrane protease YdiL (CAAX protease family)